MKGMDWLFPGLREKPAAQWTAFGFCVYALGLCTSISLTQAGLSLAAVAAAFAVRRGELAFGARFCELHKNQFIIQSWCGYIAAALLASAFAIYPARSFHYLIPDLLKPLTCIFLIIALEKDALKPIAVCLIAGGCFAALYAIGADLAHYFAQKEIIRACFSGTPVFFGEMEILALCCAFALLCRENTSRRQIIFYGLSALLLQVAVIFSQTRSALLAEVLALCVFSALEKRARKPALLILAVAALSFLLVTRAAPTLTNRMSIIGNMVEKNHHVDRAVQNRLEQWATGIKIFRDHPVFGVGPNNFTQIFHFYHPAPIDNTYGWSAHDLCIHQAGERGVVGLAALVCLLGSLLYCVCTVARGKSDPYSLAALAAFFAFMAMNITGETLQETRESGIVFLLLAAGYAWQRAGEPHKPEPGTATR